MYIFGSLDLQILTFFMFSLLKSQRNKFLNIEERTLNLSIFTA
jgi:hypothetical protein